MACSLALSQGRINPLIYLSHLTDLTKLSPPPLWEGIKGRRIFISRLLILLFLIVVLPTHAIEAKTIPNGEITKPLNVEFKQGLFSIDAKEIPLGEVLAEIEKQSGFTISIDESLKRSPVTVSLSDMDIIKACRSITSAAGLGGYGISYRSTGTPGKIGQWVVDRIVLVDKGDSPEMPDKVGTALTQKDKNQGSEKVKKPKTIEKEPYFDKRLNRYVEVVKGEVLIRFRSLDGRDIGVLPPLMGGGKEEGEQKVPSDEIAKFNKEKGTKTIKSYEKINAHRLKIPDTETVQEFIEKHLIDAKQVYIEPIFLTHQQAILVNDPSFKYQWAILQVQADRAWEINSGSPDTIVAVIDTGIDITHPDLKNSVISGVDIIDGDLSGVDDNGHGTYVAGIIAAEANNSIGIAGVSYKSRLMSVKVLTASGEGTYADLIEGIIYAIDHGARILNLSLGGYSYSQFLGDAIQYAHSSKAVIVAACGNENTDEQLYPAAYPNVIAVSATDPSDQRWTSSNYGSYIKLSAPGVGVLSTQIGNSYGIAIGTSASTAHVSGVTALILSRNPDFSNTQVENILWQTADDLGDKGRDSYYGFGRVNALKAIEKASIEVHDVAITGIRIEPETFKLGEATKIIVTVANQGTFVESNLFVSVLVNGTLVSKKAVVDPINPFSQTELIFDWLPTDVSGHILKFKGIVDPVKDETDIADNEKVWDFEFIEFNGKIIAKYGTTVHQWITKQAIDFLSTKVDVAISSEINGKSEKQLIIWGSKAEDKSILLITGTEDYQYCGGTGFEDVPYRWLRHFFRPLDGKGYFLKFAEASFLASDALLYGNDCYSTDIGSLTTDYWSGGKFFDNSLYWGYAHPQNTYSFEKAKNLYIDNKGSAYYALGHVLHLIEDASLPEHTHLEMHGGPFQNNYEGYMSGSWPNTGLITSLYAPLPDFIKVSLDQNPTVVTFDSYPSPNTNRFDAYIRELAKISYYLNRHPVDLSLTNIFKSGAALGKLGEMFPFLYFDLSLKQWIIPSIGLLGSEWWETKTEPSSPDASGFYYLEQTGSAVPQKYKEIKWNPIYPDNSVMLTPDPYDKGDSSFNYVENTYMKINGIDKLPTLAELYAKDLIPLAIRYVSGAIMHFWNETHLGVDDPNDSDVLTSDAVNTADAIKQKFKDSYYKKYGGAAKIGYPINFLHKWVGYWVQDFRPMKDGNGNEMGGFGSSIMIYNPEKYEVFVVHGDIWKHPAECTYECMGGPQSWLGPPVSNEYTHPTYGAIQEFKYGYITHKNDGGAWWEAYPNTSPIVSIIEPSNDSSVSGTVKVSASAIDDIEVKAIEFYKDNVLVQRLSSSPSTYLTSWNTTYSWNTIDTSNGKHYLYVKACDTANNCGVSSTITVNVNNSSGNNLPNTPTALNQYKSDTTTILTIGATTNERTVAMKGVVTDPDSNPVSLEVEVKPVGTAFSNNPSSNCSSSGTVASGSTATVTCSALADGQYHWQARAVDSKGAKSNWLSAGGNLESSADFIVSAGSATINYPPSVTVISPNGGETLTAGNSYDIKWYATDSTGIIQSIEISLSTDGGVTWPYIIRANETNDGGYNWTPSSITTQARIKIEAVDSYGELGMDISDGNFSIVSSCTKPSTPTLQSISAYGSSYTVSWSASSNVTTYTLEESISSTFTNPSVIYSGNGTSWYSGSKSNGTYYYRAKAANSCGESISNTQSVTIQVNQGPGSITASNPADGAVDQPLSLTLSWSASHSGDEGLRYNVYACQCDTNYFFTNNIKSYGQTSTTFSLSNLPYNTTISWGIEAIDDTGDIRFSSMFHFKTIGDSSPPTGSVLINNGAATTTSYSVTLNLSASDRDSGVRYMRFSNDGVNWTYWTWYVTQYQWNLADYNHGGKTGQTTYTVYAQFRDELGNESAVYSDTIAKTSGTPGNIILNGQYYETIRDAMNAANSGDTIFLTEGTYTILGETNPAWEGGTRYTGILMKPGVTLKGAGAERTTLQLEGGGLFTIVDADSSIIEGLTIINISTCSGCPAILLISNSSKVRNCIIKSSNTGIYIGWSSAQAYNSEISNNLVINNSDGIRSVNGTNVSILNNTVANNNKNGVVSYSTMSNLAIQNNIISNNGTGIYVVDGMPTIKNNDVYNNFTNYQGISDQTGTNGNISVDSSFVNPSAGDYHINAGSLVIDRGTNVGIPYNGSAPDMGAFEYNGNGTIQVISNGSDASFTIRGPSGSYTGSGTIWSQSNLPIGIYTITFTSIANLYSPPYQSEMLYSGQTLSFDGTYSDDKVPPTGIMSVNFDEYATADNLVTITFGLTDDVAGLGAGSQMMFSNDGVTWSPAEPYSSMRKDWDLILYGSDTTSGIKTVYAKVSDALGNWAALTDTILYVPNRQILEVPTQYNTIQAAIDTAQDGDMVYILPGTYTDSISLKEGVRLQGAGADKTIIYSVAPAQNSMVDGFTFSNRIGENIFETSNITGFILANCIIPGGRMIMFGGDSKNVIIRNNVINTNRLGIYMFQDVQATIENNTLVGSSFISGSSPTIAVNLANATSNTKVYLRNNIISNYGIGVVDENTSDTQHKHIFALFNTYWNNLYGNFGESDSYYSKSNVYTTMGPGDMTAGPLFINSANGDFHLQAGSSSINSGYPEDRYKDPDDTRSDRGAYGGSTLNTNPVADFSLSSITGGTGTIFTFDAGISHDGESMDERLEVRWDIDGDGIYDTGFTTSKILTQRYDTAGTYNVTLQVKDERGYLSTATKTITVVNQSPNVPGNPVPSDGSTGQSLNCILAWTGGDPGAGEVITYDVYLGSSSNPPLISTGQTETYFDPGTLEYSKVYYWRIVATDNNGNIIVGPLWYFVTSFFDLPKTVTNSGFSISSEGSLLAIQKGSSGTKSYAVTSVNGFNSSVNLSLSGEPSGVTWSFDPNPVTPPADSSATSTLAIIVESTVSCGIYNLDVTGTSGSQTDTITLSLEVTGCISGLKGEYYDNVDLTGLATTRNDPSIDFDWGSDTPDATIDTDTFSIRWTGKIKVDNDEVYTFNAVTDDGVRLWIDGYLVIDYWQNGGASTNGSFALTSGLHDIKLEFFEDRGDAFVHLYWSSPSTPYALIPEDHLFSPDSAGNAPTLSWTGEANYTSGGIAPQTGDISTIFIYHITYTDADGDAPMVGYPRVHILKAEDEISGGPFTMDFVDGNYTDRAIYAYSTTLPNGADYTYYFDAKDATGLQAVAHPIAPTPTAPFNAPYVEVGDVARSNPGESDEKGGDCFVATAAYGSYLDPHVQIFRKFRDDYLLSNSLGQVFVNIYYHYSPSMASFIRDHENLRTATRWFLTVVVFGIEYPFVSISFVVLIFIMGILIYRRKRSYDS